VVTSDGLKPCAAPQSPCVPPTSIYPLLRGPLRGGLGACMTGCFGATSSLQRMSLKGPNLTFKSLLAPPDSGHRQDGPFRR